MRGEKVVKRSSFGSIVRKRLSDITNSQSQPKLHKQDEMPPVISSSEKDYIDQLLKENMALMKLLEDRDKLLELSGAELQKQRITLQKMQLQNWSLAQSNSHILAELNLGREKLKALQHELICKDALLKAKNLELEEKEKTNCLKTVSQGEKEAARESLGQANNDIKPHKPNRRRSTRSRSMSPSASQHVSRKERIENKRPCLRRQSARFESQQHEPSEKLFEIEDVKFPAGHQIKNAMHKDGSTQLGSSIKKEERDKSCARRSETRESQRSSIGRPLRQAVGKVQSYKEIPVNIKMRRSE
ncbi:SHUGOSHIN 2 isoform X1 [Malania oleifera]|uniref:SHUGOSHIN 2 isoform X1 n=1 Tax=Malania oleifera TaxID=397392 RepID=UPI0025ADF117|nr:SHUGOSHIN 2 isoform X1 [Malania oleifera]